MKFFKAIRDRFRTPRMVDPDFGELAYMGSYWEGEWTFPPTETTISIFLPGDESGPYPESRQWNFDLIPRYPKILELAKPLLTSKLADMADWWLEGDMPEDIFTVVRLTGFGVTDPRTDPIEWNVSFETIGDRWVSVTVNFVGDEPEVASADT
jgi:hypothetical protein